jgi:lipopolysaccharide/colanic/teichoic acid biosynthesis glycosyltransferase
MLPVSGAITNFLARPAARRSRTRHDDLKRPLEWLFALAGLAATAPVVAVLGVPVTLTPRCPAVYSQIRSGEGGRPFRIFELRPLRIDAANGGRRGSVAGAPCVTAIGRGGG